jgi:hypothetical protein
MFNFGPSHDDIQQAVDGVHATALAILLALVEKGVLTEEDILNARPKAVAQIDQVRAARREEHIAAVEAEYPAMGRFFADLYRERGGA